MSRSYKHVPGINSGEGCSSRHFFKQQSNSKMRRTEDLPDGNAYRKNGYSYDIMDYHFRQLTRKDCISWRNEIRLSPWPCFKDLLSLPENRKHARK